MGAWRFHEARVEVIFSYRGLVHLRGRKSSRAVKERATTSSSHLRSSASYRPTMDGHSRVNTSYSGRPSTAAPEDGEDELPPPFEAP